MKTTEKSTGLKAKVLFINENWSIEFLKTRKDFVMYLTKKSLPNFDNIGGKLPKVGIKFAKVVNDNKDIEIWERVAKNKAGKVFEKLGTYSPTRIEKTATRVYYYTQKPLHKDIIASKKSVSVIFENGLKHECTGDELNNILFDGFNPFDNIENEIAEMEIEQMIIEEDAKQQEDFYNMGEDAPF